MVDLRYITAYAKHRLIWRVKMKYAITYAVHGTATIIVDLDAPPTVDEAENLTPCHQCGHDLDMGDPGDVCAIYQIEGDGKRTPIFEKDC